LKGEVIITFPPKRKPGLMITHSSYEFSLRADQRRKPKFSSIYYFFSKMDFNDGITDNISSKMRLFVSETQFSNLCHFYPLLGAGLAKIMLMLL
jgi:hypothetical protein